MTLPFASLVSGTSWMRSQAAKSDAGLLPTGCAAIDRLLDGGFPRQGFVELLTSGERRGEVSLLARAAAHASGTVWVLPIQGFEPYAPALEAAGMDLSRQLFVEPRSPEEAFRCAEAALASGEAEAVIAWLPPLALDDDRRAVSRLALAASHRRAVLFALRPASLACCPSQADLRLQLTPVTACGKDLMRMRVVRRGVFSDAVRMDTLSLMDELRSPAARPVLPAAHSRNRLEAGFGRLAAA